MMGLLLLAMSIPVPCDGEVSLSDGDRFAMSAETARYLWKVSHAHADVMRPKLVGWNDANALAAWELECVYRERCYYLLDDVLYCRLPVASKLNSLRRLKQLLGEVDYAGGRMPLPTPQYRPWTK